jgi:hypothetical protein
LPLSESAAGGGFTAECCGAVPRGWRALGRVAGASSSLQRSQMADVVPGDVSTPSVSVPHRMHRMLLLSPGPGAGRMPASSGARYTAPGRLQGDGSWTAAWRPPRRAPARQGCRARGRRLRVPRPARRGSPEKLAGAEQATEATEGEARRSGRRARAAEARGNTRPAARTRGKRPSGLLPSPARMAGGRSGAASQNGHGGTCWLRSIASARMQQGTADGRASCSFYAAGGSQIIKKIRGATVGCRAPAASAHPQDVSSKPYAAAKPGYFRATAEIQRCASSSPSRARFIRASTPPTLVHSPASSGSG